VPCDGVPLGFTEEESGSQETVAFREIETRSRDRLREKARRVNAIEHGADPSPVNVAARGESVEILLSVQCYSLASCRFFKNPKNLG
jgi:hypothetical protein